MKSTAELQGVEAKSPDGDLALDGEIQLHDPLPTSTLALYLRFRLSEPFLKSADKLQLMLQMAGSAGKRPDGFYGVRLSGRLGSMSPPVFTPNFAVGKQRPGPRDPRRRAQRVGRPVRAPVGRQRGATASGPAPADDERDRRATAAATTATADRRPPPSPVVITAPPSAAQAACPPPPAEATPPARAPSARGGARAWSAPRSRGPPWSAAAAPRPRGQAN